MQMRHNRYPAFILVIAFFLGASGCSTEDKPENISDSAKPLAGNTVEHRSTDVPPQDQPIPSTVAEAAWTWEGPDGSHVLALHPSSTGAVIQLNIGAVALDTTTGEETWSFLLPDNNQIGDESDLALSPTGSIMAYSPGQSMVVLDTGTGEELWRRDHSASGPTQFTINKAGLIGDSGLFTAQASHEIRVSLTPWEEEEPDWESTLSACDEPDLANISQGVLTDDQVVLTYACPFQETTVVGLDQANGEELWRMRQGEDYQLDEDIFPVPSPSAEFDFGVVGDLLVLQNIAAQRGTVVIDTSNGQVVADDLPSTAEAPLLRVLPDGYLTAEEGESPGLEGRSLTYKLHDFDGTVRQKLETTTEVARGSFNNFLVLEDSLLKLRMVGEDEEQDMAVLDWDTGDDERVTLPIDVDTTDIPSIARVDEEVGPYTFREVPGAVLLREFPGSRNIPRVVGFR